MINTDSNTVIKYRKSIYDMRYSTRSFVKCGISLLISGSRDSEINIDCLLDYRIGESVDIGEIEFFFTDSDEES